MPLYSSSVEYGLHCLLYLVDASGEAKASSFDLAEFQGVSPSYVAKLFGQLKTAGLVTAVEGAHGGYRLARPAKDITVLDVVEALEGGNPLFQCREIRSKCALFDDAPPAWATKGVCGIHAVMLEAEQQMKQSLAGHTLADLSHQVTRKAPKGFSAEINVWFAGRRALKSRRPKSP
ncbi:MAG: Rrf2 family transcriptional regulator [Nitrospira sp.]|nr:Rrf2 family transcriptional regulator [Nitrospira sp.]